MALSVAAMSLVSPLALGPSEHAFFWRGEVSPHTSGAFTTRAARSSRSAAMTAPATMTSARFSSIEVFRSLSAREH